MTRVMVAVDGTDDSMRAARRATELFGPDAEYLVVNVASTPVMMPASVTFGGVYPMSGEEWQRMTEAVEEGAQASVEHATSVEGLDRAEVVVEHGDPVDALCRAATEHEVDVVVAGHHRRGWLERIFDPSVAGGVIRRGICDVLVVAGD